MEGDSSVGNICTKATGSLQGHSLHTRGPLFLNKDDEDTSSSSKATKNFCTQWLLYFKTPF